MQREDWKESIRRIVNLAVMEEKNVQTICVAGMTDNVLQKEIVIAFAQAMAERGKRVLLMDANIEKEVETKNKTILDAKEKKLNLEDIIMKQKDFDIVQVVPSDKTAVELLKCGLEDWLNEAKKLYDSIVVNGLPVGKYAAGVAISALCDETILIIEKGKINGDRAMEIKREMDMNGARVLGSIFLK